MDTSIFTQSQLINNTLLENVTWLDANWMYLSFGFGLLLLVFLLSSKYSGTLKEKFHNPVWLAYFAIFVYTVHQFEEHGFDIFGRHYMFVPVFNASTAAAMGADLSARDALLINILFIWGVFSLWAKFSKAENGYYLATLPWGFAIVNGFTGHLVPIFTQTGELQYVPGAVQSIFMVAFGFYVLLVVFKQLGILKGFILPLLFGGLFHLTSLIMPAAFFSWMSADIRWPLFITATAFLPILLMPFLEKKLNLQPWQTNT